MMKSRAGWSGALVMSCVAACGGGHSDSMVDARPDAPPSIQLEILHTSDLHANLFDWDYGTATADPNRGLVRIASLVRAERAANPCTLLIDTGDTLEGAALGYYYARVATTQPHPMAVAMNMLGYDAMAIGNHELGFGFDVLQRFTTDATFPVLSANLVAADGSHPFAATTTKEVCGITVGIVGVTTRGSASWDHAARAGYHIDPILAAVQQHVSALRSAGAEVVVIAMHEGSDAALAIADMVPGVDVVLAGHAHQRIPELFENNVVITEPGYWGSDLGKVTLTVSPLGHKVMTKRSELLPSTSVTPDPTFAAAVQPAHQAVLDFIDTALTTSSGAVAGGDASRFSDTGLADLVSAALLEAAADAGTPADIAFASIPTDGGIPSGTVRWKDVFGLYGFDNGIGVVAMTGAEVRTVLEKAAAWFVQLDPAALPATSSAVTQGNGYIYDIASGLAYTLDLTQPVGSRVTSLKYQGSDVTPTQTFKVVTSSYRILGGDYYPVYPTATVLGWSNKLVVEALAQHLQAGAFDPAAARVCDYTLTPDLYGTYYASTLGASPCP